MKFETKNIFSYGILLSHGLWLMILGVCFCSCSMQMLDKKDKVSSLTQRAIFQYLQTSDVFLDMLTGKGRIKIDPLLCQRDGLSTNEKVYFTDRMRSDMLKTPMYLQSYSLRIPASLRDKYAYTDLDMDFEHDYAIIHQFSPLLPTIEPNCYLIEHYIWANSCESGEDASCVRILNRDFLRFKIEGNKITVLDGISLRNQIDFIGFGGFSKEKMDKALPGEKIIRFGN